MKRNSTSVILFLIVFYLFLPVTLKAQSGALDLTFDNDGIVTTSFGTNFENARSIAIQTDGKIIVGGFSESATNSEFVLIRYNPNGSLDSTFDNDGIVSTSIGNFSDVCQDVSIQIDGKILAAGYTGNGTDNDFALIRYNTNGSLDSTFENDGIVTTSVGLGHDEAYSLAIQNDGKIVLAGYVDSTSFGHKFALVRYNPDGSLDSNFDSDGKVTTSIGNIDDYAYSIAIQSDNKILVAGNSNNGTNLDFCIVRYNTNGSLDITFDGDGKVTTDINASNDFGKSIALQSDGKIVFTGFSFIGSCSVLVLARYNINGSLDNTFDNDGKVTTSIGCLEDEAHELTIQSDGKILVVGSTFNGTNFEFALARYEANGNLDNTFDADGIVTTALGTTDGEANSVAIQSDGKILVAGYSANGTNSDFAVVRYNNSIVSEINTFIFHQDKEIKISPNPFSFQTSIQTNKILVNATLKLFDSFGQCVKVINNINGNTMNVFQEGLPSGMYLLQFSDNNSTILFDKLIITDK